MNSKKPLSITGQAITKVAHIMGDILDDEPNIPFPRKKLSTEKVAKETGPELRLSQHTSSNIQCIRTGSKSVHDYPSQTHNDVSVPHQGSVSVKQPVNAESKTITNITGSNINTDPEPSFAVNNLPFAHQLTSKQYSGESNIPTFVTVPTSQTDSPEKNVRTKKDGSCVLGSNDVAAESNSMDNYEYDNIGIKASNALGHAVLKTSPDAHNLALSKPPRDVVSNDDVTVDDQSTSLILSEAGLHTLLEQFQNVLQQANDLQRSTDTFLQSIREDDRTSCENLERRITEMKDNLTHLEDRIQDGDKEIQSLEETVGRVVCKVDGLCELVERKSPAQRSAVVHQGGEDEHSGHRRDTTRTRREQKQSTNQKDTEHGQPCDKHLDQGGDNDQQKFDTDSKQKDGESNIPHRSETDHVTDDTMKVDLQTKVGESRPQSAIHLSSISKSSNENVTVTGRMPQKGEANSKISTDVLEHHVDDVKQKSRSNSKSKSGERKSEPKSKLESPTSHKQEETRSRSKSKKLKCSELGFKYRKTNADRDNRVQVIRHEVVLRGGASRDLLDNNIKCRNARKETSTKPEDLNYAPHYPFFGGQGEFEALGLHSDLASFGLDAFSMTEADIKTSNKWVSKANEERRKGTFLAPFRGKGPETVLLLDTSESMRGQPFNDMIRIAKEIIDGIQGVNMTLGIEENIGIAVFGQETTVLRHLTMNYADLKSSLDTLAPAGPSPFSAGFVMSLAALLGNASGITSVKNVPLSPRVILISDGYATLDRTTTEEKSESDLITSNIRLLLLPVLKDHASRGNRLFCVPVGHHPKMVYFEDICKQTKGRIYMTSDVRRLVKMTQAEVSAIEMFEGLKGNSRERMLEILTAGSMNNSSVTQDAEDIVDYIEYLRDRETSTGTTEPPMHMEQDPNMPPIGTRMRRGSTWKWANQDTEGPGTVIGHQKNGMLWIEWDNGMKNRYNYQPGSYDVKVVDEPRQILGDQLIAAGYLVKRGIDWTYGDQDGGEGSIGTVFLVKENGNVGVRWPNGRKDIYKFGAEGRFDLEICDPNTTPRPRVQTRWEGSANVPTGREGFSNVPTGRESFLDIPTGGNVSLPKMTPRNDTSHTMVQPESNITRHIESYLPSVEEMNRKNTSSFTSSSTSSTPQVQQISTQSKENDNTRQRDSVSRDVKSSVNSESPGTDYRVRWQYANSEGQFKDYPGNVNGKIEATYIKRPSGTAIINMDGVGYRISFTKMTQVKITSKETVKIRRTVLA